MRLVVVMSAEVEVPDSVIADPKDTLEAVVLKHLAPDCAWWAMEADADIEGFQLVVEKSS